MAESNSAYDSAIFLCLICQVAHTTLELKLILFVLIKPAKLNKDQSWGEWNDEFRSSSVINSLILSKTRVLVDIICCLTHESCRRISILAKTSRIGDQTRATPPKPSLFPCALDSALKIKVIVRF